MILDTNDLIGKTLGTCTIRRLIGRGGMGAVYLAQQSRPRRTVAVKVLLPNTFMDKRPREEFLARFRREADAIAALDHINILPLYEYGEQEDMAYLVMPYVTGGTLRELLEERGILPFTEVARIIEQAADALEGAHKQGIIHRDLKPANILFHADGRVLLADFGLAKVVRDLHESGVKGRSSQEGLTSAGTIVGTPEYLSPEQGTGKDVDHRTDIYSLGVMIYQMLGGQVPFTGTSPVAIAIKHTLETPPSLSALNPLVTPEIEGIVMRALAKNPAERYNSASELARILKTTLTTPSQAGMPSQRTPLIAEAQTVFVTLPDQGTPNTEEQLEHKHPQPVFEHDAVTQLENTPTTIYNASTEAAPRVVAQVESKRDEPVPHMPAKVEVAPRHQPVIEQVPASPQMREPRTNTPLSPPPFSPMPQPSPQPGPQGPHARRQPLAVVLGGALLVLLIIIGSVVSYQHFAGGQTASKAPTAQPTHDVTLTNKSTPTATATPRPLSLPGPKVSAGNRVYGTDLPGKSCDKRGGTWNEINLNVTCHDTNVELRSNGSTGVLVLKGLPQGQTFPSNYIIQVQIESASGDYGILYRNLPDTKTSNVFILSTGNWHSDNYDSSWNNQGQLASGTTQGDTTKSHTVDVQVLGTSYTYTVDGTYWGNANNGTSTNAAIGILVTPGSHVTLKNLQVFAAQ
ncbi:serine/threonine-protein kinase [Ktedonobacter racemifer]|uniref:non-specific serine/threonine protein kinase n=1 Tax=Ktedonobacter racemifer DSM 44963 TaxID=485913 RepID=D6TEP9_KTERA|nr:serine/threonine-protein kinase [Ktedonobacter racemifer]EFH88498.1 serine/threonine protein kinase [Ktedonobacter racemifer DSM 44963]